MKKLNLKKWNETRLDIEDKIMFLDDLIRIPGRGGSAEEYFDLARLQAQATVLYMARAEQRNKLHALQRVRYVTNPAFMDGHLRFNPTLAAENGVDQMIKETRICTREEQQAAIAKATQPGGILADLYQEVEVRVTVPAAGFGTCGPGPDAVEPLTVHESAVELGDSSAAKAIVGGV